MQTTDVDAADRATHVRARRAALLLANVLVFAGGGVFGLVALWVWFRVVFSIDGSVAVPTPAETTTIGVCATVSVIAAVASVVLALLIGRRWALFFGSLSALGLIAAILLAAVVGSLHGPARVTPTDRPGPTSTIQPCYSGSNTCK